MRAFQRLSSQKKKIQNGRAGSSPFFLSLFFPRKETARRILYSLLNTLDIRSVNVHCSHFPQGLKFWSISENKFVFRLPYKLVWHTTKNCCGTPLQIGVEHLYKLVWHTTINWCGTPLQIAVAHHYKLVSHTTTNWCGTPLQIAVTHHYKFVWHTTTNWCATPLQIDVAHDYKLLWHTTTNCCGTPLQIGLTHNYQLL